MQSVLLMMAYIKFPTAKNPQLSTVPSFSLALTSLHGCLYCEFISVEVLYRDVAPFRANGQLPDQKFAEKNNNKKENRSRGKKDPPRKS